jgi:hypothetical protein
MIILRFGIFVLGAMALAGCCMSASGCYVPVAGVPTAWDGQGTPPDDSAQQLQEQQEQQQPPQARKKIARAKTEVIVGPIKKADGDTKREFGQFVAEKGAPDPDSDVKLKRQLTICRDCMSPAREDDAGAARADGMSWPKN